jgi:hypothetical protein
MSNITKQKVVREYHFAILYDGEEWQIDTDTEESAFPNGTIYNTETKQWEYGYLGEGKFTDGELETSQQISNMLDQLNKKRVGV